MKVLYRFDYETDNDLRTCDEMLEKIYENIGPEEVEDKCCDMFYNGDYDLMNECYEDLSDDENKAMNGAVYDMIMAETWENDVVQVIVEPGIDDIDE